jgi:hypothetical protein
VANARIAGFLPSTSGFSFSNSFPSGIPIVNINVHPLPPIRLGDASNGVCGGMVYAVMDLFFATPRLRPPTTSTLPAGGSTLTDYIVARLVDSFALPAGPHSNVSRYIEYMSTLDHDTHFSRGIPSIIAGYEWPLIKADIDAGRVSPIGLVSGVWVWPTNVAAKVGMLAHCHQVAAYGYDIDSASNLKLLVYDPNDPLADDSTIEMNLGNPTHTTPIATPRITSHIAGNVTFRAFFRHQFYAPVTPPAGISPGPVVSVITLQDNWRWCNKCQGLFFMGGALDSHCPGGGTHASPAESGSGNYSLPHNVPGDSTRQDDWRWCNKCQGLFFGGGVLSSRCSGGGTHASPAESGSGNYSLPHGVPGDSTRQDNWRWCNKCQGLFFMGGALDSHCPGGGTHASPAESGSGMYSLPHA